MENPEKIVIKKLEAAQRQLNCAIELWFNDGDEVSIHTLAAAAYQITHDIKRHNGIQRDLLYDALIVKEEYRRDWIKAMKAAQNFFKHAKEDPDPEGTIEFSPFGNLVFLMTASAGIALLGAKESPEAGALFFWLLVHEPRLINRDFLEKFHNVTRIEDLESTRTISKARFFEMYVHQRAKRDLFG